MPIPMRSLAIAWSLAAMAGAAQAEAATEAASADAAATPVTSASPAAVPAVAERANPLGIKPMESNLLAKSRGGTQVLNDMKLKGTVANNQATNVVTGNNVIAEGSLAGASGLPMVIQNSGNNVLIQNATIVNVQMK